MFWSNPTPLRRGRQRTILGDGREVLVYVDEPLLLPCPEEPPAVPLSTPVRSPPNSPPARDPANNSSYAADTPVHRNQYHGTRRDSSDGNSRKDSNSQQTPRPTVGVDVLSLPRLCNDGGGEGEGGGTLPLRRQRRSSLLSGGTGVLRRVPSKGCGSRGSAGSDPSTATGSGDGGGGGQCTDESEASDDDSVGDSGREEAFKRAVIKVSLTDGCVVLVFSPERRKDEPPTTREDELLETEKEAAASSSDVADADDHLERRDTIITLNSHEADDEKSDSEDDESFKPSDERCQFELQPTNIHSAEDDRWRKRDNIRLAVLGAAADAYKNINVEVPDLILAQINEGREAVRLGSCGGNLTDLGGKKAAKERGGRKKEREGQQTNGIHKRKTMPPVKENCDVRALSTPSRGSSGHGKESGAAEPKNAHFRTKKLKLRPEDEIHALPCQCALTLVGMTGRNILSPPKSSQTDSEQLAESFTGSLFGGDASITKTPTRTPERRPSLPIPHTAPARPHRPNRSNSFLSLIGRADSGHKDDSMVRTYSAKAAEVSVPARRSVPLADTPEYLTASVQWSPSVKNDSTSLKLGGPPDLKVLQRSRSKSSGESLFPQIQPGLAGQASREQRCQSCVFTSMGYHEIVLLRGGDSSMETEQGCDSWDAVTIRCSDHDEMDLLIKHLRMCSKSAVVPFSPNPKAKLKKRQERERAALTKHQVMAAHRSPRRKTSDKSSVEERGGGSTSGARTCATNTTKMASHSLNEKIAPQRQEEYSRKEKLEESEKWNKCDHCEVCKVSFTLLVRRHHCRKCDRSCCGSCSSVVLVDDSKGKRYCSLCSADVGPKGKKTDESKKWSKEDHCEVCLCHFTLLTRRHHCRKCDRSVCGNCSSVLLVRGGEEKRYCNRCSTGILQKQSRELHRRFAGYHRRMPSAALPGKVHHDCHRLGVGVQGKLPHWRNYLSFDQSRRPAVGRITIELLEALAIPAIDINGKADPYVRASITGYDRDMRWILKEWTRKFSLCSTYCIGSLSPIWRGSGKRGGELLTLPVISTAGAVLRLEVLHFDILTNRRGRDTVLGVVEIPLSDITNANLRRAETSHTADSQRKKKDSYDGYCDRWYQLQSAADIRQTPLVLAKPVPDPHSDDENPKSSPPRGSRDADISQNEDRRNRKPSNKKNGMQSLEELGQRFHGWCRAPVEWVGSALNIDFPRRCPDTVYSQRSRSAIHVRIKLNCNEFGDLLSHVWFPPIEAYPPIPPYDPQVLWCNIIRVGKQIRPYQTICKFIEDAINWRHPPKTCVQCYAVFALHLAIFPQLLYFLHIYLYTFLFFQLQKTARANLRIAADNEMTAGDMQRVDSFASSSAPVDTVSSESESSEMDNTTGDISSLQSSDQPAKTKSVVLTSSSLEDLSPSSKKMHSVGRKEQHEGKSCEENEETARLNKAVQWIAKRLGDNRGLEILQFKLGMLGRDLTNLNSLWNGTSAVKICASMNVLFLSFVLHCYFSWRLLWIGGTAIWFFGSSPFSIRRFRNIMGFWRGIAKVIRRRTLHEVEVQEQSKNK